MYIDFISDGALASPENVDNFPTPSLLVRHYQNLKTQNARYYKERYLLPDLEERYLELPFSVALSSGLGKILL